MLRDLTRILVEGARGAVRLRVEGRSFARGSVPTWLTTAADFDIVGLREGSTEVTIEAPRLIDAAPVLFQQQHLFHPFDASRTAIDLLEESIAEAAGGQLDTELYDQPLLSRMTEFDRVLAAGYEGIHMGGAAAAEERVVVRAETVHVVEQLLKRTPQPQNVRISGKLDLIRHSDRMFVLVMPDGQSIKGVAEGVTPTKLVELFGCNVTMTGTAVFRPAGRVLRLEADDVQPAGDDSGVWSRMPMPLFRSVETAELRRPQGPRSGVNAIFGRWPGEESDDDFAGAIEALS
ncbi:MAG TPA: hypothetical protein VI670_10160 [Thermoanaerobaculia bacterium]